MTDPLHKPLRVMEQGRKRARALMYGAGGAFRGLATRRAKIAELVRMTGGSFGGNGSYSGPGGWGGGSPSWWEEHDDDEGGEVDPSWGVAPGVHVVMRGRCNEAYRVAVANLVAMGDVLGVKGAGQLVGDTSVPVVLILSWMGAQKKHLRRYTRFYQELGYEVHFVLNGMKTAFFPPSSRKQAARIGNFIDSLPEDRPVLIHAFSIGTGIYGLLLESLRHETEKLERFREKVVGVVFDSGPAPIFPHDVAKGLHQVWPVLPKGGWERLVGTFFWVTQARKWYGAAEDALRKFQFPSPQMYFYSGDDKVIPQLKHSVEEFMDKNKQRGVEVYTKFWDKSQHASHLKVHPDEYMQNLTAFVSRCMERAGLPAPKKSALAAK